MPVVTGVALRLEAVGTPAAFADVRLVGDFPVPNPRPAPFVVADKPENQLVPLPVIVRLDGILIDGRKKHVRLEADAHDRLGAGLENRVHRAVQRVEVIPSPLRQQVEVFLDEQANQSGPQGANLRDPVVPHRFRRQSALPERHVVDIHRPQPLGQRDRYLYALRLGTSLRHQQKRNGDRYNR